MYDVNEKYKYAWIWNLFQNVYQVAYEYSVDLYINDACVYMRYIIKEKYHQVNINNYS